MLLLLLACASSQDSGPATPPLQDGGADSADSGAIPAGIEARLHQDFGSLVVVSWPLDTAATTWVEFRVGDEDWRSSKAQDAQPGVVEDTILGVPYDTAFEYRIGTDSGAGPEHSEVQAFATGPLPQTLPLGILHVDQPAHQDPAFAYLFLSMRASKDQDSADWAVIIDRQGQPVWARRNPIDRATIHPWLSRDGTELLIDHNSQWSEFDEGAGSEIVRMRIDGSDEEVIPVPGMRHPYTVLDDRSIVYAQAAKDLKEVLVQVDPDGTRTVLWDCDDWIEDNGLVGSCGSNTLTWDPGTDRLLYSLYTMETVIEIDRAEGQTLRYFGRALDAWNFAPPESQFWWQHGVHRTDAGTLLMSAKDTEDGDETVVREYTLGKDQQTLVELATLGAGEGLYGQVMGEAHRFDNGNTLHNLGAGSRVREYRPDGTVVWDIEWDATWIGRSTALADLYDLLR